MSFSRSSKPHSGGVSAPTSMAKEVRLRRWFRMRVISSNIVRIHSARSGACMDSSFSVASTKACSMHIGET